tara:strand:- start:719 stop:1261 length:543 start_codon:yes stop_codon:yes gene_type:complete
MSNLVAVISKKSGSKRKSDFGAGQDTVLTIFDMDKSYGDLLSKAVSGIEAKVASLTGKFSDEAIAQAVAEQTASWTSSIEGKSNGGVSWAEQVEREDGLRILVHAKKGTQYIQGVCVGRKVLKVDENKPLPTNKRGPKTEVTAVKNELRKLASGWMMVSLSEDVMVYTGEEAREFASALC